MTLTEAEIVALLGPRPKARTPEYYRWSYRRTRILHPARYERSLSRKRKQK